MGTKTLKIGNAQAFWGDRNEAASMLLRQCPDIDYLTLDYLSEVSLSIMAIQRDKDPQAGYARDFINVIRSLIPFWKQGSKVKVITNAGGLEPRRCAEACAAALKEAGCLEIRIAAITGYDVLELLRANPDQPEFRNLDTSEALRSILDRLETANAYLGAQPIVEALDSGANIVIAGRVADPSLTVAPCLFHFSWGQSEWDKIAQATIAGHLIECGTQVTGGISDGWFDISNNSDIGFPIVEMGADGVFVVTKGNHSGGAVTVATVKEQLVYEIGDPNHYISPDVVVSFLSLDVTQDTPYRVRITGAKGSPPPLTLKVGATYRDGFKVEGSLAIVGDHCEEKARRCGMAILEQMARAGLAPNHSLVECLGCGDIVPGVRSFSTLEGGESNPIECILRVCIADTRKEVMDYFSSLVAPMVTAGPPGTTGYITGRPHVRPLFGFWPCLIVKEAVITTVEIMEVE